MHQAKADFPPLLPDAGLHHFTLDALQALTVDPFPDSLRRHALFSAFTVYLELLAATGLVATVWVDGSFMCAKDDPEDIDLVVVYDAGAIDTLSDSAVQTINGLLNTHQINARFKLHVFGIASDDEEGRAYWLQTFGTQRDETTPKGLAELRVNHD